MMMDTPTRRAFLGFAQNAVAAAAIGAIGVRLIETAEAMPIAHDLGQASEPSDLLTQAQWWGPPAPAWGPAPGWGRPPLLWQAQWGPPPRPGWGRPPPRRRRWVCWWHRGRRRCGWRWR
ncbi:twin-arginine translocation signal domain-containing protein [Bradyrhizobium sp. CNPSo 3448]|uniref:Twin-arginine translocation signal domain-containing protein n=1 Tax=Bradyrhizobium niftali TaxID=2560055 RepID=A0A4Y9M7S4_9BRAD|nr:twin-arginine translocation signal domain-containing protein [Bradyrhizobium niftali]